MFKMKQALVFAVAVLSIVGQAHAENGKVDPRAEAARKLEEIKRMKDAGKDVAPNSRGAVHANARDVLSDSNIKISPDARLKLDRAMAQDSKINSAVEEATTYLKSNPGASRLVSAQLAALANVAGLDSQPSSAVAAMNPSVRAKQAYLTLATKVAVNGRSWKGSSRDVLESLLEEANRIIESSKADPGDALLSAKDIVAQQKQKVVDLDKVNSNCENL